MNRTKRKEYSPWLAFFTLIYCVGIIIGFTASLKKDDLSILVPPLGLIADNDTQFDIFSYLLFYGKYIAAAFICSLIPAGVIGLPVVISLQGYSFAFGSAAIYNTYGSISITSILLTYGLLTAVSVFCTSVLSIIAVLNTKKAYKVKIVIFLIFTIIIFLFSAYDIYFSPLVIEHLTN